MSEETAPTNRDYIARLNAIQRVKPHFTVPKIQYALTKNATRLEQALSPFQKRERELKEEHDLDPRRPVYDEEGNQMDGVPDEFYEARDALLEEEPEPYDEYNVPDSHLDAETGRMADGSQGMPFGVIDAVDWLFVEE